MSSSRPFVCTSEEPSTSIAFSRDSNRGHVLRLRSSTGQTNSSKLCSAAIERLQGGSGIGCKSSATLGCRPCCSEGKVIFFCTICEAIRNARCVATDITDLNFNVLFELGFAIGAGRAIWPLVESSEDEENRLYRAFDTLTTLGHSRYTNSKSIATKVLKKKPWLRAHSYRLLV